MALLHWLLVLLGFGIFAVPVAIILHRAGRSPWWCLLTIVPIANLVGLWLFAFTAWPGCGVVQRG